MRTTFLYFIILLTAYSCSLNNSENTNSVNIDYKENLRVYISDNYKKLKPNSEIQKIALANTDWINEFYKEIKHNPIWINDSLELNNNGYEFILLLSTSYNYGLDSSRYSGNYLNNISKKIKEIPKNNDRYALASELELLLTNAYFLIGKDLNYGIVHKDSAILVSNIPRKKFEIDLPKRLLNSFKTDSVTTKLLALQPQHIEYIKLQSHLEEYLKTASLSREKIQVNHFRKDSVQAYQQSKKALILHNYLKENSSDSDYVKALGKFQTQHGLKPDGLIGKNTAKALSKSPYSNYVKAVVSLEKWRWRNNWNKDYIYVNIPSCEMKVYQNNEIKKSLNVVVGKPSTFTPELNDEMEYMIIYPFWNLPYSISSKELLPKIKKDSTYLQRNGYQVFTNKHKAISTESIDWSTVTERNFNYKIRQKGGGGNSLGIIKFIFPNKSSIYFHDTPSKRYFKNEIRAYSHGCVRVQNPLLLAEIILESDKNEYNIDSVNTYVNNKEQKRITLNTKIPVHIQYYTCGTDSNNNIVFYKDIYGLDKKLKELMEIESYSASIPELVSK
ncbi:MAG: L,D-transpeptidase family protein [Flavobacteriales bacterium]|nr:L,D-transpeptidase family protein [Flavobacteriales bacterium]